MAKLRLPIGVMPRVHRDRSRFKEEGDYFCTLQDMTLLLKKGIFLRGQTNSMFHQPHLPVSLQWPVAADQLLRHPWHSDDSSTGSFHLSVTSELHIFHLDYFSFCQDWSANIKCLGRQIMGDKPYGKLTDT